jgi:hypothetical protein
MPERALLKYTRKLFQKNRRVKGWHTLPHGKFVLRFLSQYAFGNGSDLSCLGFEFNWCQGELVVAASIHIKLVLAVNGQLITLLANASDNHNSPQQGTRRLAGRYRG